jgi:hypothetical protein
MQDHFPDVVYTREAYNYVRFRFRHQHPSDPEPVTYPILAREQGTLVGCEQIHTLLDRFGLSIEKFKESYNCVFGLSAPAAQPSGVGVASPDPR